MATPEDQSKAGEGGASGRQPSRRRRGLQESSPFYLSPTWTWPDFDPAGCQECGRAIPLHEIGWILEEAILCDECYETLDKRRARGDSILHRSCAASPIAPQFTLTEPPPFRPRPCFASTMIPAPSDVNSASRSSAQLPLFELIEPTFELTEPPPFRPRPNFAGVDADQQNHRTGDPLDGALPLFESLEVAAAGSRMTTLRKSASVRSDEKTKPQRSSMASMSPVQESAHPVDALLDKLHRQRLSAKAIRAFRQARARDPFFAEVDAMLAAAADVRDIWLRRREPARNRRAQTG